MKSEKPAVLVWTTYQRLTGQLGRPPNALEQRIIYDGLERTGGEPGPLILAVKKTAKWRADRGYGFRGLDRAQTAMRIEIDEWLKAQEPGPEIERLAKCVGTFTERTKQEPVTARTLNDRPAAHRVWKAPEPEERDDAAAAAAFAKLRGLFGGSSGGDGEA